MSVESGLAADIRKYPSPAQNVVIRICYALNNYIAESHRIAESMTPSPERTKIYDDMQALLATMKALRHSVGIVYPHDA